jgi:peptide/bleomycin uptake transporter
MIKSFFWSRRWMPYAYGGAVLLIGCMYGQIYLAVTLNEWNKRFFDLFGNASGHSIAEFYVGILEYLVISLLSILVGVAASGITRLYTFLWRKSLTFYDLPLWRKTDVQIEGASQRIQEDISRATKVIESMGWTVVSTLMTLVAFIPILWNLSRDVRIPGLEDIQGSLVWVSFAASAAGFAISWIIGTKLPEIEYDGQKIEAIFRKVLVYGESPKIRIRDEFETALSKIFTKLFVNNNRAILHNSYFDVWKYLYMKAMYILPFLLMGPGVIYGVTTIGDLMQTVNAFEQVTSGLSVFIYNWPMVTELRSICRRLWEFEKTIIENPRTEDSEAVKSAETDEALPEEILEQQN